MKTERVTRSITTEILAEIDWLREENALLRQENDDLRKQIGSQIDERVKDAQANSAALFKAILAGRFG